MSILFNLFHYYIYRELIFNTSTNLINKTKSFPNSSRAKFVSGKLKKQAKKTIANITPYLFDFNEVIGLNYK